MSGVAVVVAVSIVVVVDGIVVLVVEVVDVVVVLDDTLVVSSSHLEAALLSNQRHWFSLNCNYYWSTNERPPYIF